MNDKFKNLIILFMFIISLLLGSLLAYVLMQTKEENQNGNVSTTTKKETIEEKDAAFFDKYLECLLPERSANNFVKTIEEFSSENIRDFIYFYYKTLCSYGERQTDQEKNNIDFSYEITYTVSKKEVEDLIYKYFGVKDYILPEPGPRSSVRELNEKEYQVFWFGTSWLSHDFENTSVIYNGNQVTVKYHITKIYDQGTGTLIFKLVYNDGNYNVKSIIYEED